MNWIRRGFLAPAGRRAWVLAGLLLLSAGVVSLSAGMVAAQQPSDATSAPQTAAAAPVSTATHEPNLGRPAVVCAPSALGSPYIPVDSWVYPAVMRLYSMGYAHTVYLGLRPWTRASIGHMLESTGAEIEDATNFGDSTADEAQQLYEALFKEVNADSEGPCGAYNGVARIESVYSVERGLSGTPLRDSFHIGSSIINDYGRPYAHGFDDYSGISGYATAGRFAIYARGEFQSSPSADGYSAELAQQLAVIDQTTNYYINWVPGASGPAPTPPIPLSQHFTIPYGPIAAANTGRVMEAYVSAQVLNHVFSFGKQDDWMGPGVGAGMAYSNNAEDIYAFHINRIEPLQVPFLSRITGPFRYEFLIGPLKGHTYPTGAWLHIEKISFRPTQNFEAGFERAVIWGGTDHEPVNLKSFLRSFFSLVAGNCPGNKCSTTDPGARFSSFDFSYRLPFVRNWLTLYSDMAAHDDVSPIDAPRRACWRPGIYLSHVPGLPRLDLRAEGVSTDPPITNSNGGLFEYRETVQRDGYTNKGQLFGDWIGREDKGGQAWITWHLSGNEWLQLSMRNQKSAKDFIPGGTTLNDLNFQAVKRLGKEFEVNGRFTYEQWKAPVYLPGLQKVTNTTIQLTWFPDRKIRF